MQKYQFKFQKTDEPIKNTLIRCFYFLWIIFLCFDSGFNTWRKKFKIQEDFPYQAVPTYLQYLLTNPIESIDWFFIKLIITTIFIILMIQLFFKYFSIRLNITPEKIYWSLEDFNIYTIANKDNIQHIELVEPKKIFKSSPHFLQIYIYFKRRKGTRFFNILKFSKDDQKQIIDLCQKYYKLNPEIQIKNIFKQELKQSTKMIDPIISYTILALLFIFIILMLFLIK